MAMPFLFLAGIMTVLTAPGLIAQYLQHRRQHKDGLVSESEINA